MRKMVILGLCLAFALPAFAGMGSGMGGGNGDGNGQGNEHGKGMKHDNRVVLAFGTMFGVDDPFVAAAGMIRGIPGDEAPWEIKSVHGFLTASGHLEIKVRGLVFKDDPRSPPDEIGKNDETSFRALVSCLSTDNTTPMNVVTAGFPTGPAGNANINAHLKLPSPCVAPIVMILAGSEDKWFAMTGIEQSAN
jgi:hypothetical protein